MQSSVHENSDNGGEMEERPESPLPSWNSTNSDNFYESSRVYPRIGDKFQVNISPFKTQVDSYQLGMAESLNCKGNKVVVIEQQLAEGLTLPVVQISCFLPLVGLKEYEMTHVNGPFPDNELAPKESLSFVAVKTDGALHQHDFFQSVDERCALELSDSTQFTEDNADSSITDLKKEISRVDDTCTESTVTAENMPDAVYSCLGKKRKRGRVGWKRVKKINVDLLDLRKQRSGSRCQSPHARINTGEDANSRSYIIVPGSPSAPWSKIEEDLFILGLYIFGKNFNAVKRFVETKEMGDILSYYYGIFFRTESYCRWLESRNKRSKKCIQGQRIFSGWRQEELLTRLLPDIPEHFKDEVLEIGKTFNEGITSMEDFVTKLKILAGPNVLVQAVGIGKGKQDLTAALIDPAKANQVLSSRREIPVGQACSSLSTDNIVKILTADFRLSKAQADDLFWEAVWPCLLARGWHSEQPKDQVLFGLAQSLVFIIPGVQKFSRRKLTKGIHYFDSIREVLRRVASDPRLLELERDDMRGVEGNTEILLTSKNGVVKNGLVEHSHCYLQPRSCTNYSDSCMFTVVDTSLMLPGEQPPRIQRRVTLPLDDDSEQFQNVSLETEDKDNLVSHLSKRWKCPKHCVVGNSLNSNPKESILVVNNNVNSHEETGLFGTHKSSSLDQNDVLSSAWKQRRLSTSSDCKDDTVDASLIESGISKVQGAMLKFNSNEKTSDAALDANSSDKGPTISSLSQGSPASSIGTTLLGRDLISANNISNTSQNSRGCKAISEMGLGSQNFQDQPENTAMNFFLLRGSELLDDSITEENSHYDSSSGRPNEEACKNSGVARDLSPGPEERKSSKPQENNASALLENAFTVRRQSARVRPLTARALDAFASGVFDIKRRKKGVGKTLNSDGYHTKSLSGLVVDELTPSFNA